MIQARTLKRTGKQVYDVRLRDPDGRSYSRTFRTKREAEQFELAEKSARQRGTWSPRNGRNTVPVATIHPDGCYVYVLWGTDIDTPLYVGQSVQVVKRLGAHLTSPRASQIRSITLRSCSSAEEMQRLEARLIDEHRPPWNRSVRLNIQGPA